MSLFKRTTKQIGDQAEQLACQFLEKQGLKKVSQNFHSQFGELDLIMQKDSNLVFVEVRYRKNSHYGSPADSITPTKQDKLIKTALYYLQQHPKFTQYATRFDVVAITATQQDPEINWIQNAFYAE